VIDTGSAGLARRSQEAYFESMQVPMTKVVTLALAAVMVVGTLDAASARQKKKHRIARPAVTQTDRIPGTLVPLDREGTPIIMQGYRSPRMMRDAGQPTLEPRQRADRPVRIPRGSSTYIPPPVPSPYSINSPPAAALTQPPPAPYQPPPITTFSDRVNNAIQAYPLQKGIGNNPTDQQEFIRQRLNQ
jgi:hypothetical protein